jgi:protein-tyrosine phosphatase
MGFLSKIFTKKELDSPVDLGVLGTDIHSHLVPGIDDGSQSMEESLQLIRSLKEFGFKKLITTPHIQADRFKNNAEIILGGLEKVKNTLVDHGIDMKMEAASEYLVDDGFRSKFENGKLLTFGKNYVLVELSYYSEPFNLKNLFFDLQTNGYRVVLAHPERYVYWHRKPSVYEELNDRGINLQMNIASLTGWYSHEAKEAAEWLIDKQLVRFLGTDTHNQQYIKVIEDARRMPYLKKALDTNRILNEQL